MPVTFLTAQEREHYNHIPKLEEDELLKGFYLTKTDKIFVNGFNGVTNRFCISVQLCLIRYCGFLEEDWRTLIIENIGEFMASQMGMTEFDKNLLNDYGQRAMSRSFHLQQILKYLQYRRWEPIMDEPAIEKWLIERGMEHDNERWLLDKLCQKLHHDKILRPAIGTLERIVGSISERLNEETYQRLAFLLTPELQEKLDKILELDKTLKMPIHRWLCLQPTSNTAKSINQTLDKVAYLQEMKVASWDLSAIPINRKKRLANIVRNNTNSYLQRMNPTKRYPLMVCFLWETLLDTTDMVLTMYSDFWQQAMNFAKKALNEYQMGLAKIRGRAWVTLINTTKMVINEEIESPELRQTIFTNYPKEELQEALNMVMKGSKEDTEHTQLYFLYKQYARFKQFTAHLLNTLTFEIAFAKDYFGSGLNLLIQLQKGNKRKLPNDVSMNFITNSWMNLIDQFEYTQPQAYELCVLSVLKDRLNSGDVFVKNSRKFADFNSFLIPKSRWEVEAEQLCNALGSFDIVKRIDEMAAELTSLLEPLTKLLAEGTLKGEGIRLENDELVVPGVVAEELSESALFLREQINLRLPKVGLVEMMREVDSWVNYSSEFREGIGRNTEHKALKYAALMGSACNISLADLARSSDLDYQSLWWVANNYFNDENLRCDNTKLVNFHHKQWLCGYWGNGTLSSSDGQRFPTSGNIRNAKAIPKYFGYGKGVTFYSYVSDQYSQYGGKVIATTERDATYVLDEALANETDLEIMEHTTDTHGYTDLLFALFNLVGKQLISRLRDLWSQRLCKIKSSLHPEYDKLEYPALRFTGTVNIDYLKKHAQELQRVGASLMTGTVTASLLMSRLQSYPRQNNLMYVLLSYGQLEKTIFICNYLLIPPLRKKVSRQLNKGEQLHNLKLFLRFGGDGFIRKRQEEQQQVTVQSMSVLTNIVLVWNTIYIQEILKELKNEGYQVNEEDFEHISPAPFEHINRLGKYNFNDEIKLEENGLRALRKPKK